MAHVRVERRGDDENVLGDALRAAPDLANQRVAADGLVRDHEDPPLALGVRQRLDRLGHAEVAAAVDEDRAYGHHGRDGCAHPPAAEQARHHDERSTDDHHQEEVERG